MQNELRNLLATGCDRSYIERWTVKLQLGKASQNRKALQKGTEEKSREFTEKGSELYEKA